MFLKNIPSPIGITGLEQVSNTIKLEFIKIIAVILHKKKKDQACDWTAMGSMRINCNEALGKHKHAVPCFSDHAVQCLEQIFVFYASLGKQ